MKLGFCVLALYEKYGEDLPGGFKIRREEPDYYDLCEDGYCNQGRPNLIMDGETVEVLDVSKDCITVKTDMDEVVGMSPELFEVATGWGLDDLM